MFKNILLLGFVTFFSAIGFIKYFEFRQEQNAELARLAHSKPATAQQTVQEIKPAQRKTSLSGRKALIKMDSRGHFYTKARMNGARVDVLVDTGATSVAINKTTARRMGIRLSNGDFKYTVNTANGQTKAAAAVIKRIEIGRVRVDNVQAMVLDDKSLRGTLLGMSFLGELKSFGVKNRELILEQ